MATEMQAWVQAGRPDGRVGHMLPMAEPCIGHRVLFWSVWLGLVRLSDEGRSVIGFDLWQGPELLVDMQDYDYSLDMWSLGCILVRSWDA